MVAMTIADRLTILVEVDSLAVDFCSTEKLTIDLVIEMIFDHWIELMGVVVR